MQQEVYSINYKLDMEKKEEGEQALSILLFMTVSPHI